MDNFRSRRRVVSEQEYQAVLKYRNLPDVKLVP